MGELIFRFISTKIKTIRVKLLCVFLLFTMIIAMVCFSCYYVYWLKCKNELFKDNVHALSSKILLLNLLELQFITYESKNTDFFACGHSQYIIRHHSLHQEVINELDKLIIERHYPELDALRRQLIVYNKTYINFIDKIKQRGFKDYGMEGMMRKYIHEVENYPIAKNMELLLSLRRNEKDYLLRKDRKYIAMHSEKLLALLNALNMDSKSGVQQKAELVGLINNYNLHFMKWVAIDEVIGLDQGIGLQLALRNHNKNFARLIKSITIKTDKISIDLNDTNNIFMLATIAASILISIFLSLVFSSVITKPIRVLSTTITQIVRSNFSRNVAIPPNDSKDETGILFRNFNWLISQIHTYIDQLKQNEKIIEESEKKFRALIEHSNDAISLTDKNSRVVYASPSTKNVLGFLSEEIEGKYMMDLIHPNDVGLLKDCIDDVCKLPGNICELQFRKLHKDGTYRWLEGYFSNLLDDPSVNAIVTNYRDITSRKNNELKIDEQYTELQNINEELDRFVYSASHDLKAPLTSILGIINIARIDPDESSAPRYLTMAEDNIKRLLKVISDMTNYSRNARLDVTWEQINFKSLVEDSIDTCNYLDNFKRISFKLDAATQDFYSDKLRLSILFNNLLCNAILYHDLEKDNPYIQVSIKACQNKVILVVEDNGQGIDPEYHTHIYNMFYRVSKDSHGSGLGLYIVKGIVEKLNGTVELDSIVGHGTKFTVTLPNDENVGSKYIKSQNKEILIACQA